MSLARFLVAEKSAEAFYFSIYPFTGQIIVNVHNTLGRERAINLSMLILDSVVD